MRFAILNAFVDAPMTGNPAAVCWLERPLPDDKLLAIAAQFGYSETAFVLEDEGRLGLRWFTPKVEVDLCGHATLAAAHDLLAAAENGAAVEFETRSGRLAVVRDGDWLATDFPARAIERYEGSLEVLSDCLDVDVQAAAIAGPTLLAVLGGAAHVAAVTPDLDRIAELPFNALIPTAADEEVDFVSRFFGPRIGIPEDPVTGAAHTGLAPFWSARLGRKRLDARQLSTRGGALRCEVRGDRVVLGGRTERFAEGSLTLA